jgi:hypothetical protein
MSRQDRHDVPEDIRRRRGVEEADTPEITSFFGPKPEPLDLRKMLIALLILLVSPVVLWGAYKGGEFVLAHHYAAQAANAAAMAATAAAVAEPPPAPRPKPAQTASSSRAMTAAERAERLLPAPGSGIVMKCEGRGEIIYSDGECPSGTTGHAVELPSSTHSPRTAAAR